MVPIGSTVTFTYLVENTGTTTLTMVSVRDDNGTPANLADDFNALFQSGDNTPPNGILDEAETWVFNAARIATAGQYTNIATANAVAFGEVQITPDTDPDNHFGTAATATPTSTSTGTPTSTPTSTVTSTSTPTSTSGPTISAPTVVAPAIPALSGSGAAVLILLLLGVAVTFLVRAKR